MKHMGAYEVLSHVELPECSIRIIAMETTEAVALHYHERATQIYTVLRGEVEVRVGEQRMLLRPYETTRIVPNTSHNVRPINGAARVLSLAFPPLARDDQHVIDEPHAE
jgi:quercetin dioxygenase-like cupin family protein